MKDTEPETDRFSASPSDNVGKPGLRAQFLKAVAETPPRRFWEVAVSLYETGYLPEGRVEPLFLAALERQWEGAVSPVGAAVASHRVSIEEELNPGFRVTAREHFLEDAQEILGSIRPVVQ